MDSRAYDRIETTPTASDIVFAGASAVTAHAKQMNSVPTASDIVFAGASDVAPSRQRLEHSPTASDFIFPVASAVSGSQKSTKGAPTASEIVFAGATKLVWEPPNNHIGAPTASEIVFAGATKLVWEPPNNHIGAPTASEIVFAGATKLVSEPPNNHIVAPTASEIVFAGASDVAPSRQRLEHSPTASDIIFAGASAVSGSQKSTKGAPTASEIVFAGATKLGSEPPNNHIGAPTASEIVFAGATKLVSEPPNNHVGAPTAPDIVFAGATKSSGFAPVTADTSEAESNPSETESGLEVSEHELTGNEIMDDQNRTSWDHDEIKGLFDLFDTDNDGYLTTSDLKAFMHIWEFESFGRNGTRLPAHGRIDFPNFLILVSRLEVDLDKPLYVQEKFLKFVRRRMEYGFVLGSALRKLVIRFRISYKEEEKRESHNEKIYESAERLERIFNAFDEDGDGHLTAREVKSFMRVWETELNSLVHNDIINEIDAVWNGKIDFKNFMDLLEPSDIDLIRRTESLKLVPLLSRIFSLLDEDGDGCITPEEVDTFKRIWKTDPDEVENLTDEVDFSGKENFDFPEFFNLFPLRLKSVYLIDLKEDRHQWAEGALRFVFSLLDEDGDGCLSGEQVKSFTRVWSMMPNEAKYIIDKVEADQNRKFNYSEFLNLLPVFEKDRYMLVDIHPSWTPVQPELITQLNHVFSSLDEDGDGRLTARQVQSFMHKWRLQPNLVENIVSTVGSNGHGTVDFPNLLALLYSNDFILKERTKDQWPTIKNYIEIFISLDEDGDGYLTCQEIAALILMHMFKRLDLNDVDEFLARVRDSDQGKIDFPGLFNWLYPRNNELAFRDKSDELVVGVRDIFTILDQDGDGYVTTEEVEIFARLWRVSRTTFEGIKKEVDADWNGRIDLPHLFNFLDRLPGYLYDQIKKCKLLVKQFEDVFNSFDEDEDGHLTAAEVDTLLQMGRADPDGSETGEISTVADADRNGKFDFPSFLRLIYSTDIDPGKIIGQNVQPIKDDEIATDSTGDTETVEEDAETESDE